MLAEAETEVNRSQERPRETNRGQKRPTEVNRGQQGSREVKRVQKKSTGHTETVDSSRHDSMARSGKDTANMCPDPWNSYTNFIPDEMQTVKSWVLYCTVHAAEKLVYTYCTIRSKNTLYLFTFATVSRYFGHLATVHVCPSYLYSWCCPSAGWCWLGRPRCGRWGDGHWSPPPPPGRRSSSSWCRCSVSSSIYRSLKKFQLKGNESPDEYFFWRPIQLHQYFLYMRKLVLKFWACFIH